MLVRLVKPLVLSPVVRQNLRRYVSVVRPGLLAYQHGNDAACPPVDSSYWPRR
jgi:hypothetical protein